MAVVLHILPHPGGGGERYVDALVSAAGMEIRRIYLSPNPKLGRQIIEFPWLKPRLLEAITQADLVHVHGDAAAIISMPLLRKKRWLWTTHGLHLRRRQRRWWCRLLLDRALRVVLASANGTICTSYAEMEELSPLTSSEVSAKLVTIHNGVESTGGRSREGSRALREELGLPDDELVVLFLAALEPHKGAVGAASAADIARRSGARFTLLLAGAGSQQETLSNLGYPNVRLLGHRDPEPLLAGSDIFVLPSEREGLSLALLQAMEAGLAPIVSDCPGNPEAVGSSGLVVDVGAVEELARNLAALCRDPLRVELLGAAARSRAHALFSVDRFISQTVRLYELILREPA